MKNIIALMLLIFSLKSMAATCTSISRTNNSANQVLTSTKYNLDHNTAYAAINAFDLGCGTDGTLEKSALNTTDFEVPLNAPKEGCLVTMATANQLSVSKCYIAINGNYTRTTTATAVSMGCGACSGGDVASTKYYVYALTTSTSSVLALAINTTAPNADGYDNSGNRVLAEFTNDSTAAIQDVNNWVVSNFQGYTIEGVAVLRDERADGTLGGTNTGGGSCDTRVLNNIEGDSSFVKLSANQIVLVGGKYSIHCQAPAAKVSSNMIAFYDDTGSTYLQYGANQTSGTGDNTDTGPWMAYSWTHTGTRFYELRHCTTTSNADDGFGLANATSAGEIYAMCTLIKYK